MENFNWHTIIPTILSVILSIIISVYTSIKLFVKKVDTNEHKSDKSFNEIVKDIETMKTGILEMKSTAVKCVEKREIIEDNILDKIDEKFEKVMTVINDIDRRLSRIEGHIFNGK